MRCTRSASRSRPRSPTSAGSRRPASTSSKPSSTGALAGGSVGDLVSALPKILADDTPRAAPEHSRLPRHLAPAPNIEWKRGLERLITDATLVNLPTMSDEALGHTIEQLGELEAETSERRKALHAVIDTVEAELAARHVAQA